MVPVRPRDRRDTFISVLWLSEPQENCLLRWQAPISNEKKICGLPVDSCQKRSPVSAPNGAHRVKPASARRPKVGGSYAWKGQEPRGRPWDTPVIDNLQGSSLSNWQSVQVSCGKGPRGRLILSDDQIREIGILDAAIISRVVRYTLLPKQSPSLNRKKCHTIKP